MKKVLLVLLSLLSIIITVGCGTVKLNPPVISIEENKVTWEKVPGAVAYEVTVGIETFKVTENEYVITIKEEGTYQISVKSINEDNVLSEPSNTISYTVKPSKMTLDTPVIINTDHLIEWPAIENCEKYEVTINGKVVETVSTNSYQFKESEIGTYVITVKAISTNVNYLSSESSNEITITIEAPKEPVKLQTPVITLDKKTISWETVENADRYFVYVNGELVSTQTETSFEYTEGVFGDYVLTVKAVSSDTENFIASDESNQVVIYVPISDQPLDFSKPVAMFTLNWKAYAVMNENEELVKGKSIENTTEFQGISYQLIKDGDNYRIKLDNGKYLTWKKADNGEGDIFFAEGLHTKGNTQLFSITSVSEDGFQYIIYPLANPGYLLCENGINGFHQYHAIEENGVYDPQQVWVIHNVETTIAEDVMAEEVVKEIPLTFIATNADNGNYLIEINENGVGVYKTYSNLATETANAWHLVKVTKDLGLTSPDDAYYIKLTNGKYLKWGTNETSGSNETVEAILNDEDKAFIWHFEEYEDGYIFWNDAHGANWAGAEYANGEGHYYLREWFGSIKFADAKSVWTLNEVEAEFADDVVEEGPVEPTIDLTSPVVIYTKATTAVPTFNEEKIMVPGELFAEGNDYSSFAFLLVADGDYYQIKTVDGYYLEHVKINGVDRFVKAVKEAKDAQLFKITQDGDAFKLEPKDNQGYLICEDGAGNYHQYSDCSVDIQRWIFVNVEATFAEDVAKGIPLTFIATNADYGNYLIEINENGVGVYKTYTDLANETANAWHLVKVTKDLGLTSPNDAYYIKLTNGKYLKWGTNETSGDNETIEAVLNDEDKAFIWHFEEYNGGYIFWNDAHGANWAGAEYANGEGHYYLREYYGAIKFADAKSVWTLNEVNVEFADDQQ